VKRHDLRHWVSFNFDVTKTQRLQTKSAIEQAESMARSRILLTSLVLSAVSATVVAFQFPACHFATTKSTVRQSCLFARRTRDQACNVIDTTAETIIAEVESKNPLPLSGLLGASTATAVSVWTVASEQAMASVISEGNLNPSNFAPVCGTSDGFYRFLQSATVALVGEQSFVEYGPLIAGGLLRIRLELCVIESFFNEAVGPFIAQNGVSWVLPFHETVETFLAGVIFALATTFILIGSSKILSVIAIYADFLLGFPSRLLGGFVFDRASGKPVTLDIGFGPFKTRLVGPPKEQDTQEKDLSKLSIPGFIVLFFSGVLKFSGQALGVSEGRFVYVAITRQSDHLLYWPCFSKYRSCAISLKPLICSSDAIWSWWQADT
jgi:hypothetical protein